MFLVFCFCFYLICCLFVFVGGFWSHHAACGILVPQPGVEPVPLALGARSLKHWTSREVPGIFDSGGVCACVETEGTKEISVLALNFTMNLKLL